MAQNEHYLAMVLFIYHRMNTLPKNSIFGLSQNENYIGKALIYVPQNEHCTSEWICLFHTINTVSRYGFVCMPE